MPARFGPNALAGVVLVIAVLRLPNHFDALAQAFEPERLDLSPFRALGENFRSVVRLASSDHAPMVVHVDVPLPAAPKFNSMSLLFPYFARTSLLLSLPAGSNELYPRDRLFSLPQCAATHVIVPHATGGGHGAKLGAFFVPGIGDLEVFRLPTPGRPLAGTFASRFCPPRAGS
jgi:hypothetical protein